MKIYHNIVWIKEKSLTDDETLPERFDPEERTPTKADVTDGPPRIPFMLVYFAQVSHIASVPPSRLRLLGVNGEWQLIQWLEDNELAPEFVWCDCPDCCCEGSVRTCCCIVPLFGSTMKI